VTGYFKNSWLSYLTIIYLLTVSDVTSPIIWNKTDKRQCGKQHWVCKEATIGPEASPPSWNTVVLPLIQSV
jgi:hypothetical protein